jgi:hypothetical protein
LFFGVGNAFVHTLKFKIPLTKQSLCGTSTCCSKTLPAHEVTFIDVLYGILHDKLSRSLVRKANAKIVSPAMAIESFVNNTPMWHNATDPLIVERAARVLGSMMSAYSDSPNICVSNFCGGVTANDTSLKGLKSSIEKVQNMLGSEILTEAKVYMKTLHSGRQMLKGVVEYPAGSLDKNSDVISVEERTEFMNLNKRPSPVPVGSVIQVMPCYHPVMAVVVVEDHHDTMGTAGDFSGTGGDSDANIADPNSNNVTSTAAVSVTVPDWQPSVWVPPPGSATFVHPDKEEEEVPLATESSEVGADKASAEATATTMPAVGSGEEKTLDEKPEKKRRLSSREVMKEAKVASGNKQKPRRKSKTSRELLQDAAIGESKD